MKKLYLTIIAAALISCAPCDAMHIHRVYPTTSFWKKPTTIVGVLGLLTVGVYTAYKYRAKWHSQAQKGFNWLGKMCKFTENQQLLPGAPIAIAGDDNRIKTLQARIKQLQNENDGFAHNIARLTDENSRPHNHLAVNNHQPAININHKNELSQANAMIRELQDLNVTYDAEITKHAKIIEELQANLANRDQQIRELNETLQRHRAAAPTPVAAASAAVAVVVNQHPDPVKHMTKEERCRLVAAQFATKPNDAPQDASA